MIKFIMIAICVLWLLSKIMKYAFRFLLIFAGKQVQKEMEKQMHYQKNQQAHYTQQQQKEGTTIITKQPNKSNNKSADDGEYIDYEEVE